MRRRHLAGPIGLVLLSLAASPLRAQHGSSTAFDVALGVHTIANGTIDGRTGAMLDVIVAGGAQSASQRSFVAGVGLGAVFVGLHDGCLATETDGCAANGNLLSLGAFAGIDRRFGDASARLLAGPALVRGAGGRSVGVQSRADFTAPLGGRLGVGLMGRLTILPSHDGHTLVGWGTGLSLALR